MNSVAVRDIKFDDLFVGQSVKFSRQVTADMMEQFRLMSGDENPLHVNEEFAQQRGFKSRVVYGMLVASLYSCLAGVHLPGKWCLLYSVKSDFLSPVFVGDTLTVEGKIVEKHDSVRQIVIKAIIRNQDGKKVSRAVIEAGGVVILISRYLILRASSEVSLEFIRRHAWQSDDEIVAQYFRNDSELLKLQTNIAANMQLRQVDFSLEFDTQNFADSLIAEKFIPTHVLHTSAIPVNNQRFTDSTWNDFEVQLNVQCRSIVVVLQKLLKSMSKLKRGKILLVLSSYAMNVPPKYLSAYVTAKYALMGLGKSLAVEYAPKNIQVNMVSPSMMETKFLTNIHNLVIEQSADANPMKRNATPVDVANAIEFLFSDNNNFITGANIPITGGETF